MLQLGVQASLVRARDTGDGSYLVFVPSDRYRAEVTVRPPDVWELRKSFASIAGSYVTRQERFDLNADLAPPPDGYLQLDAELGTETRVGGETVKLALQGQNLSNS